MTSARARLLSSGTRELRVRATQPSERGRDKITDIPELIRCSHPSRCHRPLPTIHLPRNRRVTHEQKHHAGQTRIFGISTGSLVSTQRTRAIPYSKLMRQGRPIFLQILERQCHVSHRTAIYGFLKQVSRRQIHAHLKDFVVRHELYIQRTGRGQESQVLDFLHTLLHLQKRLSDTVSSQLRYTYI